MYIKTKINNIIKVSLVIFIVICIAMLLTSCNNNNNDSNDNNSGNKIINNNNNNNDNNSENKIINNDNNDNNSGNKIINNNNNNSNNNDSNDNNSGNKIINNDNNDNNDNNSENKIINNDNSNNDNNDDSNDDKDNKSKVNNYEYKNDTEFINKDNEKSKKENYYEQHNTNKIEINGEYFDIIETFNKECNSNYECILTSKYVHRLECDYQPKCYKNKCTVVCHSDFVSDIEKEIREISMNYIKENYFIEENINLNSNNPIDEYNKLVKFNNFKKGNCKSCYNIEVMFESNKVKYNLKFDIFDGRVIKTNDLIKKEYLISENACYEQDGRIVGNKNECSNLEIGFGLDVNELKMDKDNETNNYQNLNKVCCVPLDINILKKDAYNYASKSKECSEMGLLTNVSKYDRKDKVWNIEINSTKNVTCKYYCNVLENKTAILKQIC